MPISGKVYIVPNKDEKTWQLVVENDGDRAFGITQNVLPANNPNADGHDDTANYGHGLPVNPGAVSWQKFHAGDNYNGAGGPHVISEASHIRVGIRGLAYKTVNLPKLDGPPVELDLRDFNWYGGNASSGGGQAQAWPGRREYVPNAADGGALVTRVKQLIESAQTKGIKCEGSATITAAFGPCGLSHWELRFDNTGKQAWIGTVSFTRAEKNDGIGLESMAMPGKGTAAMQRIEHLGNYGVEAVPGEKLRLGVRGYSWIEVELPKEGSLEIPLAKFKIDTSKMTPEYFDADAVLEKRAEKKEKVQFFEGGKALTGSLEPKTWRGADALARSTFNPPALRVEQVLGGWDVTLTSACPEFDDEGRVGFVAGVKLAEADASAKAAKELGPRKLLYTGDTKSWHIEKDADLGGAKAIAGAELVVATRGLGWFATVKLPTKGKVIDSTKDDQLWGLREDQFNRKNLRQDFIQRFR